MSIPPETVAGLPDPQPLWFGPKGAELFGFYHAPLRESERAVAVALCPPLGLEMMCSHKSYRHLAQRLAFLGFPVLRFDLFGTGNSAGHERDPEQVKAWLASIHHAIEALEVASGKSEVSLFGVGIAAALVLVASTGRADVASLALWAPVVRGSRYVRELSLYARLRDDGAPPDGTREDMDAAGYLFTRATLDDLAGLDVLEVDDAPKQVLLIPRDDGAAEQRLVRHLEARGSRTTLVHAAGYRELFNEDPYKAVVPTEVFARVTDWLVATHGAAVQVSASAARAPRAHVLTRSLRSDGDAARVCERLVTFGSSSLFGVLTTPADERLARRQAALLFVSVGANHHVGPNRMYVALARACAALGFAVLRFDLAGIGDSPAPAQRGENALYSQAAVADVKAAMDFLQAELDVPDFVLLGLCSGAFTSFHSALDETRVRGLVLLNPLRFEWGPDDTIESVEAERLKRLRSKRYYRQALLERSTWRRVLAGRVNVSHIARSALREIARGGQARAKGLWSAWTGSADEPELSRKFRKLAELGTDVLLVFNGDEPAIDDLERALGGRAPEVGFRMEIIDGTDHVFSPVWSQELLRALLTEHLVRTFGG